MTFLAKPSNGPFDNQLNISQVHICTMQQYDSTVLTSRDFVSMIAFHHYLSMHRGKEVSFARPLNLLSTLQQSHMRADQELSHTNQLLALFALQTKQMMKRRRRRMRPWRGPQRVLYKRKHHTEVSSQFNPQGSCMGKVCLTHHDGSG